jgi:hypothetical protein
MPSDFIPNNVWASNTPISAEEDLTLPSGQTCRAKKVGLEGLLEMGILEKADSLTAMVSQYTTEVKNNGPDGPTESKVDDRAILRDPNAMKSIIEMVDRALPVIVTSPSLRLHFTEVKVGKTTVTQMIPAAKREKGVVYTDQVGFEDKMFLFEWASGGLASFLGSASKSPADVGNVVHVAKPKKSAKRASRGK